MDLVTLAHVTLRRVGSASGIAFPSNRFVDKVAEVRDGSIEILRALVVSIAEEHGELPGNLRNLRHDHTGHYTNRPDRIVFNIQGPNVQYRHALRGNPFPPGSEDRNEILQAGGSGGLSQRGGALSALASISRHRSARPRAAKPVFLSRHGTSCCKLWEFCIYSLISARRTYLSGQRILLLFACGRGAPGPA